jgi:hypothetical protein
MRFAQLMAGWGGRLVRIVIGVALIASGLGRIGGYGGLLLALIGLFPLAAGVFNFCLIAPLVGAPFWGRDAISRRGA